MRPSNNKSADPYDVALGAAIRMRRRALGVSQESLADHCGVSFQQVQKYENGANRISFSRLVHIARALDCRLSDLVDVLDDPEDAARQRLDLLAGTNAAGSLELLELYSRIPPPLRADLLRFLRTLPGSGSTVTTGDS